MDDPEKRRFLWGISLAWAPWVPLLIGGILGVANAFKGISEQKATGLGAVAGGLAEAFLMFGMVATLVFEVGAIVLLVRAFSGKHWLRSLFSVVSIFLSALMIFLLGLCVWFFLVPAARTS
ncbi:MAG: MotA/TolQ/ExbB proton channel family protein [Acidobacteriia bacterium]|nr:MotA/TolQ/ExbB proton channel family protein [Terriglobia bacterium]